ncbi:hypothetical protein OAH12_00435 [Cyclobacteriaceae bacterium]|nr:hypothetical protein [Cyclobacteriaceae bacterium]
MRVVANIPHPKFKITLFSYNEKYLMKLEAGPMEQTYKVPFEETTNDQDVIDLLDEKFLEDIYNHFTNMFISLRDAKARQKES